MRKVHLFLVLLTLLGLSGCTETPKESKTSPSSSRKVTSSSSIYYLDPDTHVQDSTYGGLKKLTPEELLAAMATCGEKNYAW